MNTRAVEGGKPLSLDVNEQQVFVGSAPLDDSQQTVTGAYVEIDGERFYRIGHVDRLRPFFMSIVSGGDHWLFIASTGGLTAGRVNSDSALFPYETEDKLMRHEDEAGSKTLFLVERNGRLQLWEPFSTQYHGLYACDRHLYKNIYGNKLIFEEVNHDLQLTFRSSWQTGDRFGFIKGGRLQNDGAACAVWLLDGFLNLLPFGATAQVQNGMSNLLNAYKRNELVNEVGLGLFTMSATLTDQAEPSESLKATVAWQVGLNIDTHLLSGRQLKAFRQGRPLLGEDDLRGQAGAYLVKSHFQLASKEVRQWHLVADVNQDAADVANLTRFLQQKPSEIMAAIEADVKENTAVLVNYIAAADGLQATAAETTVAHHFANAMFNIMRGGIFAQGYELDKADLLHFIQVRNCPVLQEQQSWFENLPEQLTVQALYSAAEKLGDADVQRLCYEYLPLTFSRRHGDPSRPWNYFSINLKHEDGSPRLDYQGNWRDIFQNWEPLLLSFPTYTIGVISKFLNATTVDGYNPYRVTRSGIEWEAPEPENPWSNIGYWSDHQIIYLQKLLELAAQVTPGEIERLWNQSLFAYADVPYRLRSYGEMLADWSDTIEFDFAADKRIETAVSEIGTDAKLVQRGTGGVHHATMVEKLLVLLLAKLTNLVPEGGIWMNTQRPEWNDANNALVGKGLSVITTAYVRRFIAFWQGQLAEYSGQIFEVNKAVANLLADVQKTFVTYEKYLPSGFDNRIRREVMDELGTAVTTYRALAYKGLPETTNPLSSDELVQFLRLAQRFVEQTLHANRRPDGLYHSYNVLQLGKETAGFAHLYLMLEGQVAMLSAGLLKPNEVLLLLKALRSSALYRADQHSYLLYPNRPFPSFQQQNKVSAAQVAESKLVQRLLARGDVQLLVQDVNSDLHFNGTFRNVKDVLQVLAEMEREPELQPLVEEERPFIENLFEETFNHHAFTGRSGTFFAYEGLGSIYWHMISKLLLAVQECYLAAQAANAPEAAALAKAYYDVRAGIGFNKSPEAYGAFPTDPYSHTPFRGGASQPGMTGQVKEELLTRLGELGVSVKNGRLQFEPTLLKQEEFFEFPTQFEYVAKDGSLKTLSLNKATLAFTLCQVPIVYQWGKRPQVEIQFENGSVSIIEGTSLAADVSLQIFQREAKIQKVIVTVHK